MTWMSDMNKCTLTPVEQEKFEKDFASINKEFNTAWPRQRKDHPELFKIIDAYFPGEDIEVSHE